MKSLTPEELSKLKPGDVLYTTFDVFDDCDGYYNPPNNIGKISIIFKELVTHNGKTMVLARGQYMYDPDTLTLVEPESYNNCAAEWRRV